MAAHQVPPSLGFSRQEHWSGLPFPSPMHESEKWKWSRSVVSDSRDPMDCSLPGSPVHGIFQARVLEWGAIAFSVSFFSFIQFYCPSRVQLTSNCLRKSSLTALAHMLFSLLWSTAACNESQFKGKSYFWITSCVLVLMLYCFPSEAGYIKDSNARSLINFHCYHLASI